MGRAPPRKRKEPPLPTGTKVAAFVGKLSKMLESCPSEVGRWAADGKSFWINDESARTSVIPDNFAHSSFRSFARQLSCYGFRKTRRRETNGWSEFSHPFFVRDEPELLCGIKRMEHLCEERIPLAPKQDLNGLTALSVAARAVSEEPPPSKKQRIDEVDDLKTEQIKRLQARVAHLEGLVTSLLSPGTARV
ncbi:hypothetical protein CTAYLR_005188 [Chrysophaeum taylorii]|uniref:HSF-type DNA-binding domain-containing protein n=1 Tax=Chrysophaeum taylorii TaxID=2483200 RepID=A0AAD7XQM4_9STRA|nr:hypothetical protein CTAYLR_005171 [Chrysophaeum taylorii]KAJ8614168.1 hypothetical protein CTAYLR_005188 [Chrysophaeum taylorii]